MKRIGRPRLTAGLVAAAILCVAPALPAQMPPGMPDARQMSGVPLPVPDVPAGTVTVRVVKGSLSNPVAGQAVELAGAAQPMKATTNETGRAEFSGIAAGSRLKAVSVVSGERLESLEFQVPPAGGIRVMLVATDPATAKEAAALAQAPATPGTVVLGDQSRFVFELNDEGMSVFNLLQIVNTERTPVQTSGPLVFELPAASRDAAMLEGSAPQGTLQGTQVIVEGPFAPGPTLVQFAYTMPYSGSTLRLEQRLPAPMTQLTLLVQKVGETHVGSPQMAEHREMSADGQTYIVGQGPALKAGDVVTVEFTGLPHAPLWPRNLALVLAVVILGAGAWASVRPSRRALTAAGGRREKLEGRRERLLAQLAALEARHHAGGIDPQRYASERGALVASLERIYAELDEEAAA